MSQADALRYSLQHRKPADWMRTEPHPEVLKFDAPVAEKNELQLPTPTWKNLLVKIYKKRQDEK